MITDLTRRDLVDLFNSYDPEPVMSMLAEMGAGTPRHRGIYWWGRLDESEFRRASTSATSFDSSVSASRRPFRLFGARRVRSSWRRFPVIGSIPPSTRRRHAPSRYRIVPFIDGSPALAQARSWHETRLYVGDRVGTPILPDQERLLTCPMPGLS